MAGRPPTPVVADLTTYPRKFLSPIQLACYIGVSRRTIYHHIDKGALRARRIGGVLRIHITEARKYVQDDPPSPAY